METGENIRRIKENLFLIPEERFDALSKDPLSVSLVYLLALLVLSLPFQVAKLLFDEFSIMNALIYAPIAYLFYIPLFYIGFVVLHILLKLLGGKASFSETVATMIHAETLFLIVGPLPYIGVLAALVALPNIVLGAKRVHKISLLRSIAAVVVIPLIIFIFIIAIVILLFAAMMSSYVGAPYGAYR